MAKTELINNKLGNLRVAVPESRQLDTMAQLLEKRGAQVLRIPLIAIHDAPDVGPVLAWIERFIGSAPDLFIILTGEGVRRLLALADRHASKAALVDALSQTPLLCRGPKPARALREIGIKNAAQANSPTTDGVRAYLSRKSGRKQNLEFTASSFTTHKAQMSVSIRSFSQRISLSLAVSRIKI